jgi:aspartyl-tRNA(Asn)/glutamyl-tRNA(Gln) amidotransferase subunit C
MIQVHETLTRQVADLARLELSDQEVQVFSTQLTQIIRYVEKLQEVDVQGVEPMTHPLDFAATLREDIVKPSPVDAEGKPKVLKSAPEVLYDGYKVPQIL